MVELFIMQSIKVQKGLVYFGPRPEIDDLKYLQSKDVSCIWNLLETQPPIVNRILPIEQKMFDLVLSANIPDFGIPKNQEHFIEQLYLVYTQLLKGKNVYIHCFGGHGRTGTAIMSLLLLDGYNANVALSTTKKICMGPEVQEQIDFVLNLKVQKLL